MLIFNLVLGSATDLKGPKRNKGSREVNWNMRTILAFLIIVLRQKWNINICKTKVSGLLKCMFIMENSKNKIG
jgi:hypothetical protein